MARIRPDASAVQTINASIWLRAIERPAITIAPVTLKLNAWRQKQFAVWSNEIFSPSCSNCQQQSYITYYACQKHGKATFAFVRQFLLQYIQDDPASEK